MGLKNALYKGLLVLCLMGVNQASATEPLQFNGHYDFSWNGITLGSLVLSIEETNDTYRLRLKVFSEGEVNLFVHYASDTEVSGMRGNNAYHPRVYETHYMTKKKPRHIKIGFDANGAITEELNEPPEDRRIRPEVPHSLKDGAYDPLTGLMAIRAGVAKWHGFDGKRLYEVNASTGPMTQSASMAGQMARYYVLSRTPLSGLTDKEKKESSKPEPPLNFYFSMDERHIPLGVTVNYFGRVQGVLVKECKTFEECKK
jgi:hypothetical protein